MLYIVMHKTNARYEAGEPPSEDIINRVGALVGDLSAGGLLVAGEGLRASSEGARVRLDDGRVEVTNGPFTGGNELPSGFTIVRAGSLDEAVDWAAREAGVLGHVEVDVRPVTEPWDIGLAPPPASPGGRRYMALRKATPGSEAGTSPSASQRAARASFVASSPMKVLTTQTLRPSARGRRYRNSQDGVSATDGPFAESKELVGGYVIVRGGSLDELQPWVVRYLEDVDTTEVDVREVEDPG